MRDEKREKGRAQRGTAPSRAEQGGAEMGWRAQALGRAALALVLLPLLLALPPLSAAEAGAGAEAGARESPPSPSPADWVRVRPERGQTWVVIVDTSRYWLNYRHATNALGLYQAARARGVPDSRIVLMVAEDFATNPRNVRHNQLFADYGLTLDVHEGQVAVDYAGDEVSVEALTRVLTGRQDPLTPRSKTLGSDARSEVVLYITGHGGENFMKFQDNEQMLGEDIADVVAEMARLGRFGRLTLVVDTCKAATFCQHIATPNVACLASSLRGENSYSKHGSEVVGNSLVDEMSHTLMTYLKRRAADASLESIFRELRKGQALSTPFLQTPQSGTHHSGALL